MSPVDLVAMLAGHRCDRRCSAEDHCELVWLPSPDGPEDLDRQAVAAGILLHGLTRPARKGRIEGRVSTQGSPARPEGLTSRYRPWLVCWDRTAPVTTSAACDAPSGDRAGVEPEQHDGRQLALFATSTDVDAFPGKGSRPRRTA